MAKVKDDIKTFYKRTLTEDSGKWLIDDKYILNYIEIIINDDSYTPLNKIKEIKGLISAYKELHNN